MTKDEALRKALEALKKLMAYPETIEYWKQQEAITAIEKALAQQTDEFKCPLCYDDIANIKNPSQPEQEPFFTEANGFPQEFVPKDRQKQAIISMTDQVAALVWERDELQKQVWVYEKNGVTCQTYRHKVDQSCSECNVQMNYTTPPQRTWVGLTDKERETATGWSVEHIEDFLKQKNGFAEEKNT